MSLMEWRDEYAVGVPDVDYEHQELVNLINELHDKLISNASEDRIIEFLGELYARITAHFSLEEKIMRENEYDEYEKHKEDHEFLLDELRDMMDRYEDEGSFSEQVLAEQIGKWFGEHFKTMDARLHSKLG